MMRGWLASLGVAAVSMAMLGPVAMGADGGKAKIVVIAGRPSHGPGEHEFNAGARLLVQCLAETPGIEPVFVAGGWPADASTFDGAKALVFFMDGGGGHPIIQGDHLDVVRSLMDKGVGLACLHYAVEIPAEKGGPEFLKWLGGYYESGYSTNPHWVADIKTLPDHPITRGVHPFAISDEWYFNIRFRPDHAGITPIVVAKPDDRTREGTSASPRGPHAQIVADKGRDEILAWATERPDGGRGFGFTGAHFHKNWADPNFRKLVLNALVWTAQREVPPGGVTSSPTAEELTSGLDPK